MTISDSVVTRSAPDPALPTRLSDARTAFEDADVLRNDHGMVAIISKRKSNGALTFSIYREFERAGSMARTAFFPLEQGEIYLDFTRIVIDRMRELRAGAPPSPPPAPPPPKT